MGRHTKKSVICCYDFDGLLIKTYSTAKEASDELGLFKRSVDKAIRMSTTLRGYQWRRYESIDELKTSIEPYQKPSIDINNVRVAITDKGGNIFKVYPSIRKAGKENHISPKQIRECLNGHQQKAGGHYWKKII